MPGLAGGSMWACLKRLGRTAFAALPPRTAGRARGDGRGLSRLAWSRRLEWAAGDGPLRSSGYLKTGRVIVCHFCSAEDHNVSYKELRDLLESKAILLIDVRERWEINEHGKIPGSVNIPLGEVVEALQMDSVHFKEKYNQDVPSKSDHIVFSCLAGVRSNQALVTAKSLGFCRAQQYGGGFQEWAEHESSVKK